MPTGTVARAAVRALLTACALSVALLVAGCGGVQQKGRAASGGSGGELFLQPVADPGPDPFTDSTAIAPRVTRTPQSMSSGGISDAEGVRSLSGATPGLYGGTRNAGSCDVERQTRFLTEDPRKARAFAQASGISQASVPDFLRGLTSVVLRADTRVTDHGFHDRQATSFQSVLQVGTAVLVDNRGVPRLRCASGNPLDRPAALEGTPGTQGRPWSGYRPTQVVEVSPAPTVITNITIINVADNSWIERRIGDDGHHDHVIRPPGDGTRTPRPDLSSPSASPYEEHPLPGESPTDCGAPPAGTVPRAPEPAETAPAETPDSEFALSDSARLDSPATEPSDCAGPSLTAPPTTDPGSGLPPSQEPPPNGTPSNGTPSNGTPPNGTPSNGTPSNESTAPGTDPTSPDRSASQEPSSPSAPSSESSPSDEDIGPDTVPDSPDLPDGGGLIPEEPPSAESIFDAPTDIFDS
ncbi:DUF6777 domain-containing protein [Streptomyces sp. NPDC058249]|uniref:DUF6777 domain-containing protein n=1 Tax=Streptomyces sp. NPDC058249 TaxID=3346403 RepID=UPI0036DFF9D9